MAGNTPTGVRIALDPLRFIFNDVITSPDYVELGVPFENFCRILAISNNTNKDILVSLNKITPHFYIAANGFIVRDYSSNKDNKTGIATLPLGTQLWVAGVDKPTSGYVYAEVTYVANN